MKFIDSIFDCGFKDGENKPVFSRARFWIRAFENSKKVFFVLTKVQKVDTSTFKGMSDVLANKLFFEIEVDLDDFFWIEHFPETVKYRKNKESLFKVDYRMFGRRLRRVDQHKVFLEQIEHQIGEELQSLKVLDLRKKKKIKLEGFD